MTLRKVIETKNIVILPPMEAAESLALLEREGIQCTSAILDPWYNSGVGGTLPQKEYDAFIADTLAQTSKIAGVIYLWGFPEVIGPYVRAPLDGYKPTWLTWYYKNCPSVIRGWRSSQQACIQFRKDECSLHPENFLEGEKLERFEDGKMRFVPGPPSVIEAPLIIGFIGKNERVGHPAQKAEAAIKPLVLMSTVPGDIIVDPMAGSGTTAAVAQKVGRKAIVCDKEEKYIQMMERRLGTTRIKL